MSHELCEEAILMKHGRGIDRPNKRVLGARSVERGAERGGWKTLITSGLSCDDFTFGSALVALWTEKISEREGDRQRERESHEFTFHDSRFTIFRDSRLAKFFLLLQKFWLVGVDRGMFLHQTNCLSLVFLSYRNLDTLPCRHKQVLGAERLPHQPGSTQHVFQLLDQPLSEAISVRIKVHI